MILQGKWEEAEAAPLAQGIANTDGSFPESPSILKRKKEADNHCSMDRL